MQPGETVHLVVVRAPFQHSVPDPEIDAVPRHPGRRKQHVLGSPLGGRKGVGVEQQPEGAAVRTPGGMDVDQGYEARVELPPRLLAVEARLRTADLAGHPCRDVQALLTNEAVAIGESIGIETIHRQNVSPRWVRAAHEGHVVVEPPPGVEPEGSVQAGNKMPIGDAVAEP